MDHDGGVNHMTSLIARGEAERMASKTKLSSEEARILLGSLAGRRPHPEEIPGFDSGKAKLRVIERGGGQ